MTLHPDRFSTSGVVTRKRGVVIHDSESGDDTYPVLLRLLAAPGDRDNGHGGVYGSGYSAITDGKGGYDQVATAQMGPYHAPPLNKTWWGICMPGRANQTREQWLDPTSRNHIRGVARFIVDKHKVDGFPLERCRASDLLAGDGGYTAHADVSQAWHQTDHTDPGANFPWDVLAADIDALTAPEEEDMVRVRLYVPGDAKRAEALVAIEMKGFNTPNERDVVTGFYAAPSVAVTAAEYDAVLKVATAGG